MRAITLGSDVSDEELARVFAGLSDDDLNQKWEESFQWRDWDHCELIYAEQHRRAKIGADRR